MSEPKFISRFSPNRTAPEDLEAILVQRQDLLANAVELLRESALTGNKHHLLFIGPRGCGKTHLLALIVHRLGRQADLADRLRIAWLNEDETSTSFLDLLMRIYRALAARHPDEFPQNELDALYGGDPAEGQSRLAEALVRRAATRTVLVVIENLDALFKQLEPADQRAWRALIQNQKIFATAASAQSLFAGVSDRHQPFFGFFDTRHLAPLTVDEATELLAKIARLNGNRELEEFLAAPRGHARVRAIHHLSGGNHRLYIVLSEFITRKTLEELTRPFEQMVDEQLTPYYQERLRWLSPQQRKIVEFLCLRSRPAPVKEIAEKLFATHPTIASQLKQLREMGYVVGHQRGRESLYELAEPLMRLSVQVKDAGAGQPLALLVDFLRVWYAREELQQRVTGFKEAAPERAYFVAALEKCRSGEPNLRLQFLREEVEHVVLERCDVAHLETLKELAEESGKADDWFRHARACYYQARYPEALTSLNHVIETPGTPVYEEAECLILRAETLRQIGRIADAITDYTRVTEVRGAQVHQVAWALTWRGSAYGEWGRLDEAIADHTRVVELPGASADDVAEALNNRGFAYGEKGRTDDAIADYTRVIELPGASADNVAWALTWRGSAHGGEGRSDEAIADCTRAIELPGAPADNVAWALISRGSAYRKEGRLDEAIADYTRVVELPGASADNVVWALSWRGVTYGQKGRTDEAIADHTRVIELPGAPADNVAWALIDRAMAYREMGRVDEAIGGYTRAIGLVEASPLAIACALIRRGVACDEKGQTDEAIVDYTRVIELPGAPAEQVTRARWHLAQALSDLDRWDAAIEQVKIVLAGQEVLAGDAAFATSALVAAVFRQMGSPEVRQARLDESVELYARCDRLPLLGEALVRHLAKLTASTLNHAGLEQWWKSWDSAPSAHDAMQLPLRLLRVGIDYIKTDPRDEGVLLRLHKEERAIVRQALELPPEAAE